MQGLPSRPHTSYRTDGRCPGSGRYLKYRPPDWHLKHRPPVGSPCRRPRLRCPSSGDLAASAADAALASCAPSSASLFYPRRRQLQARHAHRTTGSCHGKVVSSQDGAPSGLLLASSRSGGEWRRRCSGLCCSSSLPVPGSDPDELRTTERCAAAPPVRRFGGHVWAARAPPLPKQARRCWLPWNRRGHRPAATRR